MMPAPDAVVGRTKHPCVTSSQHIKTARPEASGQFVVNVLV